jgi:hypothetical protein
MATWDDLKELRLRIKDPLGAINLLSVANEDARLDVDPPARQTAYQQADTSVYYTYDTDLAEWDPCDLLMSDARLGVLIDLYGAALAAPRAVNDIKAELGQRIAIARTQDGAGQTDYTSLKDMYQFYKDLAASMVEEVAVDAGTSTGRMFRMRSPRIGGGMH